jgi:hypothetical protein
VGKEWEIAIPVSALPNYLSSINFGLYLEQPMITDVVNLDGSSNTGSFAGIVYDGLYGDWTYYPHTTVQYAGSGTQALEVDARGALYAEGSTVYGHFVTTMSSHLGEAGGEFTSAVSICFNGNLSWDQSKNFYPRFIAVDSQGNIDWNPQLSNLQVGQTYEFYLASLDAWGTSTNINNLNEHDQIYGKMMITIGETKDECEFYLDLQQVANKLDCDVSDLKRIDAQFGRLGQEWVTTAGASSGAAMGVLLCCTVTGGVWYRRKQKGAVQS